MGKGTYRGPVPKDHPMLSGEAEAFSKIEQDLSAEEAKTAEQERLSSTNAQPESKMTVQEFLDYFKKTLPTCKTAEDFHNLIMATPSDFPPMREVDPMPEIEALREKLRREKK